MLRNIVAVKKIRIVAVKTLITVANKQLRIGAAMTLRTLVDKKTNNYGC